VAIERASWRANRHTDSPSETAAPGPRADVEAVSDPGRLARGDGAEKHAAVVRSVNGGRIRDRAWQLDPHRAVGVDLHSPHRGELAETRAVGAHGEDLVADGIRAHGVTTRQENHRAGYGVSGEAVDTAVAAKVSQLAEMAPERVDREDLPDLTGVGAEGIGVGPEEDPREGSDAAQEPVGGRTTEVGQLEELLAVQKKEFPDRTPRRRGRPDPDGTR
jgi:hypothetical protein